LQCSISSRLGGFEIDNDKAVEGLAKVRLPGRMEMICEDPRILIDGAHNAASIRALMHAIGQSIPYDSMIVIFGCNEDKDVNGMLQELAIRCRQSDFYPQQFSKSNVA